MSEVSLRENPYATSSEGILRTNEMLVSCVASANETATRHYKPEEIIESIRADKIFKLREPIQENPQHLCASNDVQQQ